MSVRTCPNCGHSIRDDDRFCSGCGAPADARRQAVIGAPDDRPRRAPVAARPAGIEIYLRALRRFWWVLAAGAAVALLSAVSSRYEIGVLPPKLTDKTVITYSSSSRLLVTSQEASHVRYQFSFFGEPPEDAPPDEQGPLIGSSPPDINTLVRAANLFPLLIESDQVARFRDEEYGPLQGSVSATGIYSVATGNRFELSEIPVIQLISSASTPEDAIEIVDKTAKAFVGWMVAEQESRDVPRQDRILVQQLNSPTAAVPSAGPSQTLPVLIFAAVFGAFCVLAILLDRLVPPRPWPLRADVEALDRPVKVKQTA